MIVSGERARRPALVYIKIACVHCRLKIMQHQMLWRAAVEAAVGAAAASAAAAATAREMSAEFRSVA